MRYSRRYNSLAEEEAAAEPPLYIDQDKVRAFARERFLKDYGEEEGFVHTPGTAIAPLIGLCEVAVTVSPFCESPIETIFATDLKLLLSEICPPNGWRFSFRHQEDPCEPADDLLLVFPQFRWKSWRFDFALKCANRTLPQVLVECDGKEWHSSEVQVQNDRRKDAEADRIGVPLLRFTGAEIHQNPRLCTLQTLQRVG